MTSVPLRGAHQLFGIELPIVLGPMAGGPSTPQLAAAVSNAGGLGSLGEGYRAPAEIRADIRAVRSLTDRPFAVNLFVPETVDVDAGSVQRAIEALAPYRRELGLPPQVPPERTAEDFDEQLEAVIEGGAPVFTYTFGLLPEGARDALHRSGTVVGGTATTPAEARAIARNGADFVVAQGAEAGGHRGSFLASGKGDDLIGLIALVPAVLDVVDVPVVAAGGLADGRGIAAALVLGASAAQLGTAFLLCPEAGTNRAYRQAVASADPEDTVITRAFSGRRARGIANRLAADLAGRTDLPPYPVLNAMTRELRQTAAARDDSSFLSLWAGQGVGGLRPVPAGELVDLLARETSRSFERWGEPPR